MFTLAAGRRRLIMLAMLVALLFTALNQTIVTTALPRVVGELGGIGEIGRLYTAYILAAVLPALLIGRLCDLYGRRPFILGGLLLFIVGSYGGGLAASFDELVWARVLQGLGGGAITISAFSAVGDFYPPHERGHWQGVFGSVYGLASLLGPALGGTLVEHGRWQWVFWAAIPLGVVALFLLVLLYPQRRAVAAPAVDGWGTLLVTAALLPLLWGCATGGYDVLLLVAASALAFIAFLKLEYDSEQPLLPWSLLTNRHVGVSSLILFAMGAGIFAALVYLPLFLQVVLGLAADVAGLVLMAMTVSLVISSYLSGLWLSRRGHRHGRGVAWLGLGLISGGLSLLSFLHSQASVTEAVVATLAIGIGLGLGMPVFNLGLQNAVAHDQLGVATAAGQLSRQLGSVVGVAYMGTLTFQPSPGAMVAGGHTQWVRAALHSGLSEVFVVATVVMLLALVPVRFLQGQTPLNPP